MIDQICCGVCNIFIKPPLRRNQLFNKNNLLYQIQKCINIPSDSRKDTAFVFHLNREEDVDSTYSVDSENLTRFKEVIKKSQITGTFPKYYGSWDTPDKPKYRPYTNESLQSGFLSGTVKCLCFKELNQLLGKGIYFVRRNKECKVELKAVVGYGYQWKDIFYFYYRNNCNYNKRWVFIDTLTGVKVWSSSEPKSKAMKDFVEVCGKYEEKVLKIFKDNLNKFGGFKHEL